MCELKSSVEQCLLKSNFHKITETLKVLSPI